VAHLFGWKTKGYANGPGFRLISFIYTNSDSKPYWHWQGDRDPHVSFSFYNAICIILNQNSPQEWAISDALIGLNAKRYKYPRRRHTRRQAHNNRAARKGFILTTAP